MRVFSNFFGFTSFEKAILRIISRECSLNGSCGLSQLTDVFGKKKTNKIKYALRVLEKKKLIMISPRGGYMVINNQGGEK